MGSLAPLMGLGACVLVFMAMFEGALARDHPPKVVKCEVDRYKECYKIKHRCPKVCSSYCVVDCVACKPVCSCDMPGAVCQDPRFVGGDGITFYFHGKKNKDFCLVSDSNLHINAHFIGKRGPNMNMKRDFTWVQSIGILFNNHQIYVGAQKTSTWKDSADHLSLSFNGEPILLPPGKGSKWVSTSAPGVSIQRSSATNGVTVQVDGNFKIDATVVPITEEESRVHGYGVNEEEDCFAHLELGFKFYSLTEDVNGVLGQTYGKNYISRVKMGAAMPVMGGNKEFAATGLFVPDCAVARFQGLASGMGGTDFPSLSCGSGMCMHGDSILC